MRREEREDCGFTSAPKMTMAYYWEGTTEATGRVTESQIGEPNSQRKRKEKRVRRGSPIAGCSLVYLGASLCELSAPDFSELEHSEILGARD